jgi:transcriptional regulator with XRE-family HTH domain
MINEIIDSPFSNGRASVQRKLSKFPFRKDEFEIAEHFYLCDDTKEEFTTSDLDRVNLNQVYNQYRKKYGLPFPDQIKNIRQKYGVSASKMSEILGLGTNSYRLYEQGEMPSIGNGRLIMTAENPYEFRKSLSLSREIIGAKDFEKLDRECEKIIEEEQINEVFKYQVKSLFNRLVPDEFTGYRQPSIERISHMIVFFSSDSQTWTTKLNKLLFYCDFLAFKNSGFGISGLDYRAIKFGPVPAKYETLYSSLGEGELLTRKFEESGGYEGSYFVPRLTFNELLFDQFELEIMRKVSGQFKFHNVKEMIDISHTEQGWIDNFKDKNLISYKDYGFALRPIQNSEIIELI